MSSRLIYNVVGGVLGGFWAAWVFTGGLLLGDSTGTVAWFGQIGFLGLPVLTILGFIGVRWQARE